jgi:hypothetical protein
LLRHARDHPSAADDLPRLGPDRGHDAIEFGVQFRVAQLIPGKIERGLGRIEFGFGGSQVPQRGIVVCPGGRAAC